MNRFSLVCVAVGFLALGCGATPRPSNMTTTPTNPTFTAALSSSNAVSPTTGPEASGSGNATITMVVTRNSANDVTAATATFVVNLTGFPPGTPINLAHIHQGASGTTGTVVVNSGITAGENVLTNGSGTFTAANLTMDPAIAQQILNNAAGFYFDVHTTINPLGAARGQLNRTQ